MNFIQKHGPVDDREAYGNLNMGAGFALYVPEGDVHKVYEAVLQLCTEQNYRFRVFVAGHIENGVKKVLIRPKGLEFAGETLAVSVRFI